MCLRSSWRRFVLARTGLRLTWDVRSARVNMNSWDENRACYGRFLGLIRGVSEGVPFASRLGLTDAPVVKSLDASAREFPSATPRADSPGRQAHAQSPGIDSVASLGRHRILPPRATRMVAEVGRLPTRPASNGDSRNNPLFAIGALSSLESRHPPAEPGRARKSPKESPVAVFVGVPASAGCMEVSSFNLSQTLSIREVLFVL